MHMILVDPSYINSYISVYLYYEWLWIFVVMFGNIISVLIMHS